MKAPLFLTFAILVTSFSVRAQNLVAAFKSPVPLRPAYITALKAQPNGDIIVGGNMGYYQAKKIHNLIRIHPDGSLDNSFTFLYNNNFLVTDIELTADGEIVIMLRAHEGYDDYWPSLNSKILRLSSDGTIEKELSLPYTLNSLALQDDGKIITAIGSKLVRYNSDFSQDDAFSNAVTFDADINTVEVAADKIFAAGPFSKVNGVTKNDVVKLNLDGTVDNTFDTGFGTSDYIGALTIQSDGKVILGDTYINSFNGVRANGLARLNANGSVDTDFVGPYFNGLVSKSVVTPDGIYGGAFMTNGIYTLFKLHSDGSFDYTFNKSGVQPSDVYDFGLVLSGSNIFVAGKTSSGNAFGLSKTDLNGNYDATFAPEVSRTGVFSVQRLFNGKLLVGGDFIRVNGVETYGLVSLNYDGSVDDAFALKEDKGIVRQIEVVNGNTILTSTYLQFFKVDASGNVLSDFNWTRGVNNLYQVIKFEILPDGKIIAGDANVLARLNSDGSQDETFITRQHDGGNSTAFDFDVQGTKYIYGSVFSGLSGVPANKLVRFLPNGNVDPTFDIGKGIIGTTGLEVVSLVKVLSNNEILIGGDFNNFNGVNTNRGLVKLSADGAIDLNFNNNLSNWFGGGIFVYSKAIQVGSVIYISGDRYVYAINTDGSDANFNFPGQITVISNMLGSSPSIEGASTGGRIENDENYLYAVGSFQVATSDDPITMVKLSVDKVNSTTPPVVTPPTTTTPPPTTVPPAPVIAGVENGLENSVTIFPQPVTDVLNIDLKQNTGNFHACIYDLSGRKYGEEIFIFNAVETPSIDISNAAPGFYILTLTSDSGTSVNRKFLKIH